MKTNNLLRHEGNKKLFLRFFVLFIFLTINVIIVKIYYSIHISNDKKIEQSRRKISSLNRAIGEFDNLKSEMEWYKKNQPMMLSHQEAQTKLQQYCEKTASGLNVNIINQQLMFHKMNETDSITRSNIKFKIQCAEEVLYRWIDVLNDATVYRAVTSMALSTNSQNESLIDCTLEIEQAYEAKN